MKVKDGVTLCVQEQKLKEHMMSILNFEVWKDVDFTIVAVVDGVHAQRNKLVPTEHGGLFTSILPRIKDQVVTAGIVPFGRGNWHHLQHALYGTLGIIHAYIPIEDYNRTNLWLELENVL